MGHALSGAASPVGHQEHDAVDDLQAQLCARHCGQPPPPVRPPLAALVRPAGTMWR